MTPTDEVLHPFQYGPDTPGLVEAFLGIPIVVTEWVDGTPFVIWHHNTESGLTSLTPDAQRVIREYDLQRKLATAGGNYAVQGIVAGPTIYGLDVYDLDKDTFLPWRFAIVALRELGTWPVRTLSVIESATLADVQFPAGGKTPSITVRAFDNRRSPVIGGDTLRMRVLRPE